MNKKGIVLIIILAIGIAAIFALVSTKEAPVKRAAAGLQAPSFELKDIEGKMWRLSDLKGKVVLVNFWATWCDSCKSENPSIQKLINLEKDNDKFIFISILFKDKPSNAVEYMKANNFTFPVLIDDKDIASAYGITGVPETFIIGKDGLIRKKVIGPVHWDSTDVRAVIANFIKE
jgi:peroxiredoxin